jgi:hypothetical protein
MIMAEKHFIVIPLLVHGGTIELGRHAVDGSDGTITDTIAWRQPESGHRRVGRGDVRDSV